MDNGRQHICCGLAAGYHNADIHLHSRVLCETPLTLAAEKSAHLYALLFLARNCAESGTFSAT